MSHAPASRWWVSLASSRATANRGCRRIPSFCIALFPASLALCGCSGSNGGDVDFPEGATDGTTAGDDGPGLVEGDGRASSDGHAESGGGEDSGTGEGDGAATGGHDDASGTAGEDAGPSDAGVEAGDAGPPDSGTGAEDGGHRDAGADAGDAGRADAEIAGGDGSPADARTEEGNASDAGLGAVDSGGTDSGTDAGATEDGGTVEASAGDGAAAEDATVGDAAGSDAASDAACTALPSLNISCPSTCNGASNYCVGGEVPNMCTPIPAECQCAETHTCACLMPFLTSPCDGGIVRCTSTDGELFVTVSDCP